MKIHDTVGDLVSLTHLHDLVVDLPYAYFSLQCHTSVRKLVEIPAATRTLSRGGILIFRNFQGISTQVKPFLEEKCIFVRASLVFFSRVCWDESFCIF